VLDDKKLTLTEKKHQDNGDYVDVKHDYRIVSLGLCSKKPSTTT
jgi:hypothetical protein